MAVLALLAVSTACGDDASPTDAGPRPDGSVATRLPTCDEPRVVSGEENATVMVELDTTDGPPGPLDVSDCLFSDERPPQAVIAYEVPGTGPHAMTFSLINSGTDSTFDTLVIVRDGACGVAVEREFPPQCFDDPRDIDDERRSQGAFGANGGDTVYIIVTGYPAFSDEYTDEGPFRIEITAVPNTPPTLDSASVLDLGDSVEVEVTAGDEDLNAAGVIVSFHDETKGLIGTVHRDTFEIPVTGAASFVEVIRLGSDITGATEAWVWVYDDGFARSERAIAPVVAGRRVGFGDACDAMNVCGRELSCAMGMCAATPDRAAACAAAMAVTLETPAGATTTTSVMGALITGNGLFRGSCGNTTGTEQMFRVTVPAGRFDLVARTDNMGTTDGADTVVYVRGNCVDPTSELEDWCDDDSGDSLTSAVVIQEAPAGDYTIFVEDYAGVMGETPTRFELSIALRPVLASGAACDVTERDNRCAGEPCSTMTETCP